MFRNTIAGESTTKCILFAITEVEMKMSFIVTVSVQKSIVNFFFRQNYIDGLHI